MINRSDQQETARIESATDRFLASGAGGAGLVDEQEELRILRSILEGTARSTGDKFFQSLVRQLAAAADVSFAFVTEFTVANTRLRTLAFWFRDNIRDNLEYDLAGTPCEDVIRIGFCHYPHRIKEKFPEDQTLFEWGIESYLGVPLRDDQGNVLGHLAIFDGRPMSRRNRAACLSCRFSPPVRLPSWSASAQSNVFGKANYVIATCTMRRRSPMSRPEPTDG